MVKNILFHILFLYRASSNSYLKYLRKKGCKIGDGTTFFYPRNVMVDITNPCLIEIGKNVQITKNVSILTHGYDWSVVKGYYGYICGSAGKVKIGNNVFIGFNTTILKGSKIGDNVIIGANSLVNSNIPNNCVAVGNPAKVIMSLDDYFKKRKEKQLDEAYELFSEYYRKNNCIPKEKIMREFVFLFKVRNTNLKKDKIFNEIGSLVNNYEQTYNEMFNSSPKFNGYDDFVLYCIDRIKKENV